MHRRPQDTLPQASKPSTGPCARRRVPSEVLDAANLAPPLFICAIMCTIWAVYMGLHLLPLLQVELVQHLRKQEDVQRGFVHFVVSQALILQVFTCYGKAMLTMPGTVPDTPEWSLVGGLAADDLPKRSQLTKEVKLTGERRHCKWCLRYKPDRCHHCRVCNTCILKMDHHCPWIMNCVGSRNHKYFFLLVLYSVASCGFVGTTLLGSVRRSVEQEMTTMNRFLLVLGLVLTVIMGSLLSIFFGFHIYLMLNGMTTIEYCEKSARATTGLPLKRQSYDRGFYRNLVAVLGPRPSLWLMPTSPPEGDGTDFRGIHKGFAMEAAVEC